jgi:hypothetical protein
LTVTAGPTDLKAGDDITLDKANDFVGTVNVLGGNDVTLNDVNSITLGGVNITGKLDVTAGTDISLNGVVNVASLDLQATAGDITQGASSTLTVTAGPTDLKAGDDITLDKANDFNGVVNVLGGNDVTLNDVNSIMLGNVTTTGKLDITAADDISLNGVVNVASLDLEATAGDITQGASSTLTVTAGPTDLKAGDDITLDKANDFVGTVNVLVGDDIKLNDINSLALGDVTASGQLGVTTTTGNVVFSGDIQVDSLVVGAGGGILQDQKSPIRVIQNAQLVAGNDIVLNNPFNDFGGAVDAAGDNVGIFDKNALSLRIVNARGDLLLASVGSLNLGSSSVGGDLTANSGGGDISQNGPLLVMGMTQLDAGAGSISLRHPGNKLTGGVTVKAASYAISGDAKNGAQDVVAQVISSVLPMSGPVNRFDSSSLSQPLVLTAAAAASSSPSSDVSFSAAGTDASSIMVDLRDAPPESNSLLMVAVSLPKGTATVGTGFSFNLPESVRSLIEPGVTLQVSLQDGSPLPNWIKFDAQEMCFEAAAVPSGAFPLQLVSQFGDKRILVVVSERVE